jgi:hypothetical protein
VGRVETERADVRIAEERNPEPAGGEERRAARLCEVPAAADDGEPGGAGGLERVEKRLTAEVQGVVVGDADRVDARAREGAEGCRWAAERVLLAGDREAARRDRALEVGDGEVGAAEDRSHVAPRVRGAAHGEVDVADRGELERPDAELPGLVAVEREPVRAGARPGARALRRKRPLGPAFARPSSCPPARTVTPGPVRPGRGGRGARRALATRGEAR